jgi:hypothetical protein
VLLHVTIDIAVMEDIYTQKSLQEENEKIDFLDLLDVTIFLVALLLTGAVMIGWGSAFLFLFACLAGIIHTCSLAY